MWHWFDALTGRLRSTEPPVFLDAATRARVVLRLRRGEFWGNEPPSSPGDPESWVRSPRPSGPGGRSAVASVAEPDEHDAVNAVGRHR